MKEIFLLPINCLILPNFNHILINSEMLITILFAVSRPTEVRLQLNLLAKQFQMVFWKKD